MCGGGSQAKLGIFPNFLFFNCDGSPNNYGKLDSPIYTSAVLQNVKKVNFNRKQDKFQVNENFNNHWMRGNFLKLKLFL